MHTEASLPDSNALCLGHQVLQLAPATAHKPVFTSTSTLDAGTGAVFRVDVTRLHLFAAETRLTVGTPQPRAAR